MPLDTTLFWVIYIYGKADARLTFFITPDSSLHLVFTKSKRHPHYQESAAQLSYSSGSQLSRPRANNMPPPAIEQNRHDGHLIPRGLSGPTQGVVIGTLVGSFVFFGLLIWLYHCVNEEKGAYSNPLYFRPPFPPRPLRDLGQPSGGIPPPGRSYSLSPPRAPRFSGGLRAPVNSPLRPVRRAASHAPAPSRRSSPLQPRARSPLRPLAPPPPRRTPSPRPRTPSPRAPHIRVQPPTISPPSRVPRRAAPPLGRDLGLDLERARTRDLHHDLERRATRDLHQDLQRAIPPRDLRSSALQLERERDLARRMAEQNDRERSHCSLSTSGRRPPRILVTAPGHPARRPPPSSSSSSSMASSGPAIVVAEPGPPARRPPPSSSSATSSSSGPIIVTAEPRNPARRPPSSSSSSMASSRPVIVMAESGRPARRGAPPPSSSSSTLVPLASRNGRRGHYARSQPPMASVPRPGLGSSIALVERRPKPPPSSSSLSSSLGDLRRWRRTASIERPSAGAPPPTSQNARTRASGYRHVPAADELRHPSRRPPSSVSSSQGPPRGRARDITATGPRLPPRSASSAGRGSDDVRSNVSYERVRRVPGAWRD